MRSSKIVKAKLRTVTSSPRTLVWLGTLARRDAERSETILFGDTRRIATLRSYDVRTEVTTLTGSFFSKKSINTKLSWETEAAAPPPSPRAICAERKGRRPTLRCDFMGEKGLEGLRSFKIYDSRPTRKYVEGGDRPSRHEVLSRFRPSSSRRLEEHFLSSSSLHWSTCR